MVFLLLLLQIPLASSIKEPGMGLGGFNAFIGYHK
jgi:hypothetical protein